MNRMYIACNNSLREGYALGDMITLVRAAWLFVRNEPHDGYVLSINKSDPLNFLWSRFVRENSAYVIYDNCTPTDTQRRYAEFDRRRRERSVHGVPFATYKELFYPLHRAERQHTLCGRAISGDSTSIFEHYYFGQETHNPNPVGVRNCDGSTIDFTRNLSVEPNSVFVAIHEKCQGNRIFTLRLWQSVIQELMAQGVIVYVNDNTNFMGHLDNHPRFRRVYDSYDKLINRVASQRLVACGNTGIGWVAAATETPFIALERNMYLPEFSFSRCGCKSLIETISEPRPERIVSAILQYLKISYNPSFPENALYPTSRGIRRLRGRRMAGVPRF